MGNSLMSRNVPSEFGGATIHSFFSSGSWIEGAAEDQLKQTAVLPGMVQIAAFPDLHPGKDSPVGCAFMADRVYPALVGSDIGCGMALFELDLIKRRTKINKAEIQLRKLGEPFDKSHAEALESEGLSPDLWPSVLGTIGGGNHFCELQICIDSVNGILDENHINLLVHSGSRGLGDANFRQQPLAGLQALSAADAMIYLKAHDEAIKWAKLNRRMIAQRAAMALRADLRLIVDNTHNLVTRRCDRFLHRKGAAVAGGLVPLAGSHSTESYLIDTSACPQEALESCAHGSGRKFNRRSMHGRINAKKSSIESLSRNSFGGRVICEDKALLIEEAPSAFKSSADVLTDLTSAGIGERVATLQPFITFKKTREKSGK